MGRFFQKLKLLVWKNFALRKRQIFRNVVEVICPLVLFMILVAVRQRRPPEYRKASYYKPQALPSAGLLPFLQTFACDFGQAKSHYPINGIPLRNAAADRLFADVAKTFQNSSLSDTLTQLPQDLNNAQLLQNLLLNPQNSPSLPNVVSPVSTIVNNVTAVKDFLQTNLSLTESQANTLLSAQINVTKISSLLLINGTNTNPSALQVLLGSLRPSINNLGQLLGLLQGLNNGNNNNPLGGLVNNPTINSALLNQVFSSAQIRNFSCNPTLFFDVLIFTNRPEGENVRKALCNLDNAQMGYFVNELRHQVNFTALITIASPISAVLSDRFLKIQAELTRLLSAMGQLESLQNLLRSSGLSVSGRNNSQTAASIATFLCGAGSSKLFGNSVINTFNGGRSSTTRIDEGSSTTDKPSNETINYNQKCYNGTGINYRGTVNITRSGLQCQSWTAQFPHQHRNTPAIRPGRGLGDHNYCRNPDNEPDGPWCYTTKNKTRWEYCTVPHCDKCVNNLRVLTSRLPAYFTNLLLKGKILFSPNNTAARKIIKKANETFVEIQNLMVNVRRLLNATSRLEKFLQQNPQQLQNLMNTVQNPAVRPFLNAFGVNVSFFDPKNNNSIMSLLHNINYYGYTVLDVAECVDLNFFEGYDTEYDLEVRAMNTTANKESPILGSIVFMNLNNGYIPRHVKYKLRQDVDFTPDTYNVRRGFWLPGPTGNQQYYQGLFVVLQDAIERAIMENIINVSADAPGVYLQQFPYPCYIRDLFASAIGGILPLFMTLSWIYTAAMIVKAVVHEKELRLKEVMKMMGLDNGVHWAAWFIQCFIIMLLTVFFLTLILRFGRIFMHSNPVIIFLFFMVFSLSTIMLCFLMSVFFTRANVAAACGGIIFFLSYFPSILVILYESVMTSGQKGIACLSSTTAFALGCNYIAQYEQQGVGIQWSNVRSSPVTEDTFSFSATCGMMIIDTIIYAILTWYLENVFPGQYGVPRRWYFPFQSSYWFSKPKTDGHIVTTRNRTNSPSAAAGATENSSSSDSNAFNPPPLVEEEPTHLKLGVSIQNLVKIYKTGNKLAVDELNLNLYEDQITSFLGHNGAGKTTTMSILTGLFPPTSGTAHIYGKNITEDMDSIRESLGLCPQHNVLFENLTVEEHLWFYARLKGLSSAEVNDEVNRMIDDIGLRNKRHDLSSSLSGGMKRKLSVGIAFIGGSKTVILDEPTAGVDPYARRGIWDLVLKYRKGKTILLSTHFMDEADLLGDRIAIISRGKLRCCGSSLFLKTKLGSGYYLTLVKDTDSQRSAKETCLGVDNVDAATVDTPAVDVNQVSRFISGYIPEAKLAESYGSEITYILPQESARSGVFHNFFSSLDRHLKTLRINSYGLSDTTLEEIFLKVADETGVDQADGRIPRRRSSRKMLFWKRKRPASSAQNSATNSQDTSQESGTDVTDSVDAGVDPASKITKLTGWRLKLHHFQALFRKRYQYARRNKKGFVSAVIVPVIFICIAMLFAMASIDESITYSRKLTPEMFTQPLYTFSSLMKNPIADSRKALNSLFSSGIGDTCMGSNHNCTKPYKDTSISLYFPQSKNSSVRPCSCRTGSIVCPTNAEGKSPPRYVLYQQNYMINLTDKNVSDYLMKVRNRFVLKIYGGFSFGEIDPNSPNIATPSSGSILLRRLSVRNVVRAWYNNKGYHAMPTYLNAMNNAILRSKLRPQDGDSRKYGITAYNHPMNLTRAQLVKEAIRRSYRDLLIAVSVIFALSFIPASFVLFLINERSSKAKHLQFVSGVHPVMYWLSNYAWDMVNYLFSMVCILIIFLAFNDKAFTSSENFPALLMLLFLYGWSIIPMMYPSSYVFSVPSTAYVALVCINIFIGINGTIATFILELFENDADLKTINNIIKQVFLIFPNYCMGRGIMDLAKNQLMADVFSRFGENNFKNPFGWELVGRNLFAMAIEGVAFFILVLLMEYRFFIKQRKLTPPNRFDEVEDEDVAEERRRVLSAEANDGILRLENLTKVYRTRRKKLIAVDRLCVSIPQGQCFGLLGINGAGKTTTFKMLTGDIDVTKGDAFVDGHSILSETDSVRQRIGYCPQFDAILDLLTGREHLMFFARLRGIPESEVAKIADWGIKKLGLIQYRDRLAGTYSGGNKRKLSTAISLVGNPPIIFLDEPTTGMDPKARRFLWDMINNIVRDGRSVVLTSHSMEECEALCTRIAIMVNGKFKCIGSIQHLKNKFGSGYTVQIRVKGSQANLEPLASYVSKTFSNVVLVERHHNQLQYHFPENIELAKLFDKLDNVREKLEIDDYSVSQTTLDEIFIGFAKQQRDDSDDIVTPDSIAQDRELTQANNNRHSLIDVREPIPTLRPKENGHQLGEATVTTYHRHSDGIQLLPTETPV